MDLQDFSPQFFLPHASLQCSHCLCGLCLEEHPLDRDFSPNTFHHFFARVFSASQPTARPLSQDIMQNQQIRLSAE